MVTFAVFWLFVSAFSTEKLRSEKPIAEPQKEPTAPLSRESIAERLDNIILECLLMKKELIQTK